MSDQWMGSIAAQDQYRQLGNDPWTNTMRGTTPAPGQGFVSAGADPVLYHTASPLVDITEGDIGRATEVGLAASGGGLKGQQIKAYHSSPHDFDKFDLSKIGTGEGAQVYGHGLYFAENPAVSGQGGQYWKQFLGRFPEGEREMAERLQAHGFKRDATAETIQRQIDELQGRIAPGGIFDKPHLGKAQERTQNFISELSAERDRLLGGQPVGPRTYEVNINADPAHMLDWDKPLRDMSPEAQRAAGRIVKRDIANEPGWGKLTGEQFHTAVGERVGRKPEVASALREAGIPGIKYLDQGSRNVTPTIERMHRELAGYRERGNKSAVAALEQQIADAQKVQLSSNYVIFDPNRVTIEKKYGIPAAIGAGGMGALAAQDAYRGDQ